LGIRYLARNAVRRRFDETPTPRKEKRVIGNQVEVLNHSGQSDYYQGAFRLGEHEMTFDLTANEEEPDYWTLHIQFVEQLNPAPPANRWARKKPTSRTSELVIWYYSTKAGRPTVRSLSDWDASGQATWFGGEAPEQTDSERQAARKTQISSLVRTVVAALGYPS